MSSKWNKLLLCVLLCLGGGWLNGLPTEYSVATWYPTLVKPSWTPPNFAFPIAWTILYLLMAVSLWLVWTSPTADKKAAYTAFAIQLFLNFIWSWLFFYLENPILGLMDCTALWIAIVITIACFWRHSRLAGSLLIPYLVWVSYAWCLNLFIWTHN